MTAIGVIPARWGSTRFEGKVLAEIAGKPMIQHVWERTKQSKYLADVLIATDDERIMSAAKKFGAKAVMTAKDHASGTDRIAEAVKDVVCDIVINIQGDEPLIQHQVIDDLVKVLEHDKATPMATAIKLLSDTTEFNNPNVVKVVIDHQGYALYFSRATIPFNRDGAPFNKLKNYKHLGIYAYRKDFLLSFNRLPSSYLEQTEKLEQLRVLEAGYKIKTVVTDIETIGVDTREDLVRVLKVVP
ncbi:MAG: 3-deoxy-manno-octulosonate cytidylyltransferase [Candidatus Omnitrophica bacterium]|nr:3-deoxy-manno-octulosonate cytidylyltransferase [Candidatus Omnitrophota bacterium]